LPRTAHDARVSRLRARGWEYVAALAACLAFAWFVSRRLLEPDVFSDDALVHQFWMWRWRDPALFTDGLTHELMQSARYPLGYEALIRAALPFAGPIVAGEWLGVALYALSGFLVFLIVREHTGWRPAAWIAAALFLALVDIHRFHGGFPRAFVHPVVLLTVLLAIRRHHLLAAATAAAGALLYPPAALLAVGVLCFTAVIPRPDSRRIGFAAAALAVAAAAVLLGGEAPEVLSAAEARAYPDFGPHGVLPFFADTPLAYLRQNRSGFDLRATGSILALAALALLVARPANLRLLRPEVAALPVVSLTGFAAAQAVLFQLYLPHRYTYPLLAFFAIAVGVTLEPTWKAVTRRRHAFALLAAPPLIAAIAVAVFPLGPRAPLSATAVVAIAAAVGLAAALAPRLARAPALGAAASGLVLLIALGGATQRWERGSPCPVTPGTRFIASLPKDAVIAGDPIDLKCLPGTARRAVVISTQLAPSYETGYFHHGRERMFATLRAYYGADPGAITALARRYGVTHLYVRRNAVEQERRPGGARWRARRLPFGRYVRGLLDGATPAVLDLPSACRSWRTGAEAVYDIACIGGANARGSRRWGPTGSSLARSWTTSRGRSTALTGGAVTRSSSSPTTSSGSPATRRRASSTGRARSGT
jgi:hypothetical protein